jgi:hypothetical protein
MTVDGTATKRKSASLGRMENQHNGLHTTAVLNRDLPVLDWYLIPESFSHPLIVQAIQEFGIRRGSTLLDPFCGAGTTVVTAKLSGLNGVGIEVNPFLCFAARTKLRVDYSLSKLKEAIESVVALARDTFRGFQSDLPLFSTKSGTSGIQILTQPPFSMPRMFRWISPKPATKVLTLKESVLRVASGTEFTDFFLLALAAILRQSSNMKLQPHAFGSRVEKEDAPVLELFEAKVRKMYRDLETMQGRSRECGEGRIHEGDCRAGDIGDTLLPAALAITSPPYLNNLDYTMQTRLELFFLGFVKDMDELRALRKKMIICDAKAIYRDVEDHAIAQEFKSIRSIAAQLHERLGGRGWGWDYSFMTLSYFGGIYRMLCAVKKHMRRGGRYLIVTGDSAHGGIPVPVTRITGELGVTAGWELEGIKVQRTRRSSSHQYGLDESIIILRRR